MAAPVGPKKVHRYTSEFKIQAVRLSLHPEIQTQDVAHALDIHPFMLSRWKKEYRDGKLKPVANAAGLSLPKYCVRRFRIWRSECSSARSRACKTGSRRVPR